MNRTTVIAVLFAFTGCNGNLPSTCEMVIDGMSFCVEDGASVGYCEDEWGGAATVFSSESGCIDLGYAERCSGWVVEHGGDSSHAYWVQGPDECDPLEGVSLD